MSGINFKHIMPCRLKEKSLHEWLINSVRDTDRVDLWPKHLNRVRITDYQTGRPFQAEYRLPYRSVTRPYILERIEKNTGFVYVPGAGHPFSGRVHVMVQPHKQGSALAWYGTYIAPLFRPERAFFRLYFEPRFFSHLGNSLLSL